MTTVASAYPLITALRIGKDVFVGGASGRNWEITRSRRPQRSWASPAQYLDSGIRFTVILRQPPPPPPPPVLPEREQRIYDLLDDGPRTAADLVARSQLPIYTVRRILRALRAQGLIQQQGGQGQPTVYQRQGS